MQNSSARASVDVGSVIAGTYTIEAMIGRGGMGAVFLASHNRLPGKKVAIKVLHAEMEGDEVVARFNREAKIASLLSHPNIVHVEDFNVTEDGMPYLVLEYLQGDSLAQRLRNGPLPLDQTFSIIRQVASALAAAHGKNIVHRDLKPANIFLVPAEIDGAHREIAKVLDFGISKMRDGSTVKTQDSALLGTPQYMAPEQATGQHDKVDGRTDIFALGAIVYEMLSGTPAFSGLTIPEVVFKVVYEPPVDLSTRVPNLPENVRLAVQTAMAKDAAERYPTVSAFVEALTGSPVSLMRAPKPAIAEPGKDALAQTMPSHNAAGIAKTMPSQNRPPAAADEIGTAGTAPAMPAARGRGMPIAIAAALVVAGVIIGVVVMNGEKKHGRKKVATSGSEVAAVAPPPRAPALTPATPTPPAPPTPAPPPTTTEAPAAAGSADKPEAPAAAGSAKKPDAKPEKKPPKPKPEPLGGAKPPAGPPPETISTTPLEEEPESVGENATRLRAAASAIKQQQWKQAESDANAVLASEDATERQRTRARMIHGIVKCHTNDEEAAKIDLRQLAHFPVFRQQMITACRKLGYLDDAR